MRILIILFFFLVSLYSKSIKEDIVSNVLISSGNNVYTNIDSIMDFKDKVFSTKFIINTEILEDEEYYLRVLLDSKFITSASYNHVLRNNMYVFKIDKKTPKEILMSFDFKDTSPALQVGIFNKIEFDYIMSFEKLIFGITYGIMFCALLYNLAFFYFNRQNS